MLYVWFSDAGAGKDWRNYNALRKLGRCPEKNSSVIHNKPLLNIYQISKEWLNEQMNIWIGG